MMRLPHVPEFALAAVLVLPGAVGAALAADTLTCASKASFLARQAVTPSVGDPGIDVTFYRLALTLNPGTAHIGGTILIRARVVTPGISTVSLDLSGSMVVDSVRMHGSPLAVLRYPSSFTVQLPRQFSNGEDIALDIAYHGVPLATGFGSFAFASTTDGPWIWSLSEPYGARDWWPCKDHPLDKADSVDILVTVPDNLKVGSNGILQSVTANGDGTKTHFWRTRYPIATYLVSVAIAPYVEFTDWYHYSPTDSLAILNYVLPQRLNEARPVLAKTVGMLDIFSRLFGPYPFLKEKYGHCQFGSGGAMEHQTMTSTTSFDENVIAHELAHQWFGDLITCQTWQDLWLNEGFATYSESLYREARYGAAQYQQSIRGRMSSALGARGSLFVQDTSNVGNLFASNRVYSKGASVLHMLRHVLGDSVFFRAIRAYADDPRFRYGTANSADFQSICETVSGRPLGFFFDQWVYGESYPRYTLQWTASPEGSRFRVEALLQQQTGTTSPVAFTMPIDLRCSAGAWDTTLVLWNSTVEETYQFTIPVRPDRVELDPDHWILREILDADPPIPVSFELDQNFPNPFNGGTTITYRLPRRVRVRLDVCNILGQTVATLVDGIRDAGTWSERWEGRTAGGMHAASGIYYYRLVGDEKTLTRTMIYLQ